MSGVGGAFNEQLLWSRFPSIFELFAQEAMTTALQPAIEYVIKVLTHNFPTLLGRLWVMRDELFLLVNSILEGYSIGNHGAPFVMHQLLMFQNLGACRTKHSTKIHQTLFCRRQQKWSGNKTRGVLGSHEPVISLDASFSEHFYNMKRVIESDGAQLTTRIRLMSWLLLVAIPYLRIKLENYYVAVKDINYNSTGSSHDASYYLLKLYPVVYFTWESLFLVYRLRYLFQKSKFYSPLLWAAGVKLIRTPVDEMMSNSTSLFSQLLGNMLPAVAFSLKFLQWWYSGDQRWAGLGSLPSPPPPSAPPPHPQGVRMTSSPTHCALCEYPYTTPTALQTSGHVFCYTCIHDYIRKHGCCPVTKQPTNETQLIRLFVQS